MGAPELHQQAGAVPGACSRVPAGSGPGAGGSAKAQAEHPKVPLAPSSLSKQAGPGAQRHLWQR